MAQENESATRLIEPRGRQFGRREGGEKLKTPYLSTKEAAKFLDTTMGNLANRRYRGEEPRWIKFKRRVLYDRRDLEDYVQRHKVKIQI